MTRPGGRSGIRTFDAGMSCAGFRVSAAVGEASAGAEGGRHHAEEGGWSGPCPRMAVTATVPETPIMAAAALMVGMGVSGTGSIVGRATGKMIG